MESSQPRGHLLSSPAGNCDASSLRHELRRQTADLHRRLEGALGLLEPGLSIDRYRRVLQSFLGYYVPIEAALARAAAASPPLGFPLRARSELIASDLLSLGLSRRAVARLPRCTDLPRLSGIEALAGCVYVLEGACLGGQVIAPALQRQLGLAKGRGASFFGGDGEGTPARWRVVLASLERLAQAGAETDRIISSACATFLTFARWVEREKTSQPPTGVGERRRG